MPEIAGSDADPDPHRNRRLIAILVGAVLLPSAVLWYLAIDFVHRLATVRRQSEIKRAEANLYYIEKELKHTAQRRVREAARLVGEERLLDGRREVVRLALIEAGRSEPIFDSLHLEPRSLQMFVRREHERARPRGEERGDEPLAPREWRASAEEQMPWLSIDGRTVATLHFKFAPGYVRGSLVREYFEKEFQNPSPPLIVRVSQLGGAVVYENAPNPYGTFEVTREMGMMDNPSFNGLKLFLGYRDRSIARDVGAWKARMLGLIGFIDLVVVAGLYAAYRTVRGLGRPSAVAP